MATTHNQSDAVSVDEDAAAAKGPHYVDLHVGASVRARRRALGLSQEKLAEHIGLTFQQLQKYEKGANRISASKLYQISLALKLPIERLFDGLDEGDMQPASAAERGVQDFMQTREGLQIAREFPAIGNAAIRRRLVDLVRGLAEV